MKRVVQNDVLAGQIVQKAGLGLYPPYAGLLVQSEAGVHGAVVISHFDGRNAEITTAGQDYWTAGTVREVLRYVFDALACERLSASCERGNKRCIAALKAVGFKREGCRRASDKKRDLILFGMLRAECRWLKGA